MRKRNNITNNDYSDEWYTNREDVELCLKIFHIPQGATVCIPFDTDKSNFVQVLKEKGYKLIYGITDWLTNENYQYDYLITNPLFSIKDKILERAIKSGKPMKP